MGVYWNYRVSVLLLSLLSTSCISARENGTLLISTVGDILKGHGCFQVRDVALLGEKVSARDEFCYNSRTSCKSACKKDERCIAWSYKLGKKMRFLETPSVPICKDESLSSDIDEDDPSCYHSFDNDTELSLRYSFGATFSILTCDRVFLGCENKRNDLRGNSTFTFSSSSNCLDQCQEINMTYALITNGSSCECSDSFQAEFDYLCKSECQALERNECSGINATAIWRTGNFARDGENIINNLTFTATNRHDLHPESMSLSNCRENCSRNQRCLVWNHNGSHCTHISKNTNNVSLTPDENTSVFGFKTNDIELLYHSMINVRALKVWFFNKTLVPTAIVRNENDTITFWKPGIDSSIEFHILSQLVLHHEDILNGKGILYTKNQYGYASQPPISFELIWTDNDSVSIWNPVCPEGYYSLGMVGTDSNISRLIPQNYACLRKCLLKQTYDVEKIWSEVGVFDPASIYKVNHNKSNQLSSFVATTSRGIDDPLWTLFETERDEEAVDTYWVYSNHEAMFDTKTTDDVNQIELKVITKLSFHGRRRSFSYQRIFVGFPKQSDLDHSWTVSGIEISPNKIHSIRLFRQQQGLAILPPTGLEEIGVIDCYQSSISFKAESNKLHINRLKCPEGYHFLGDIALLDNATFNSSQYSCIHEHFLSERSLWKKRWWPPPLLTTSPHNVSLWKIKTENCLEENLKYSLISRTKSQPAQTGYLLKKHRDGEYPDCASYSQQLKTIRKKIESNRQIEENRRRWESARGRMEVGGRSENVWRTQENMRGNGVQLGRVEFGNRYSGHQGRRQMTQTTLGFQGLGLHYPGVGFSSSRQHVKYTPRQVSNNRWFSSSMKYGDNSKYEEKVGDYGAGGYDYEADSYQGESSEEESSLDEDEYTAAAASSHIAFVSATQVPTNEKFSSEDMRGSGVQPGRVELADSGHQGRRQMTQTKLGFQEDYGAGRYDYVVDSDQGESSYEESSLDEAINTPDVASYHAAFLDATQVPTHEDFSTVKFTNAKDVFYGWGCLKKRDYAMLGEKYIPNVRTSLLMSCEESCMRRSDCLSWSVVPESVEDMREAECHQIFNNTLLSKMSLIHFPGALMELRQCVEGYIGCFEDNVERDLRMSVASFGSHPVHCMHECSNRGYAYAGLQNKQECWCGESFGVYKQYGESQCAMSCQDSPLEICGDYFKNSVYRTGNIEKEELCIFGNFFIDAVDQDGVRVISDQSLRRCASVCQNSDIGLNACVLWSHNGTHCLLIPNTVFTWAESDEIGKETFVGNNMAFTGFPICNEPVFEQDLLFENENAITNQVMVFETSTTGDTLPTENIRSSQEKQNPGFYTWTVSDRLSNDGWLMLGQPYTFQTDESYTEGIRIVRALDGNGLVNPLDFDLVGHHNGFFFFNPICPQHYESVGDVVLRNRDFASVKNKYACVHEEFTSEAYMEYILRNLSTTDQLHIAKIVPKFCEEGETLFHFVALNNTIMKRRKRFHTLKKLEGVKYPECHEHRDSLITGTSIDQKSTQTTTAETSTASIPYTTVSQNSILSTSLPTINTSKFHQSGFTLGDILNGWGCFEMRNFAFISTLVSAEDITNTTYKDICIKKCERNKECLGWSYILDKYDSNENITEPARCYHLYSSDPVKSIEIIFVKDAFISFTSCSLGYVGCFRDKRHQRDLPGQTRIRRVTIKTCESSCFEKKQGYFGLQFGRECWCGNTFGMYQQYTLDSECSASCFAKKDEICGGLNKNSLYRTGNLTGDMCVFAQASFDVRGSMTTSTRLGVSIYQCWETCKRSYRSSDPCLVWTHNATHCQQLTKSQIIINGQLRLKHQNFSYTGFSACDQSDSLFHHMSNSMEMSVKLSKNVQRDVVISNRRGGRLSLWSAIIENETNNRFLSLGQSINESNVYIAKIISGNPLEPPDDIHRIHLDHVNAVEGTGISTNNEERTMASLWHLDCPNGYRALGDVISPNSQSTSIGNHYCIFEMFLNPASFGSIKWRQDSPDEASVWEIIGNNAIGHTSLGFFTILDHNGPPETDEYELRTLKGIQPEGDQFLYNLQNTREIETKYSEQFENIYMRIDNKVKKIIGQGQLPNGWFYLGFGGGVLQSKQLKIVIGRNIQGDGIKKPHSIHHILNIPKSLNNNIISIWKMECPEEYYALSDVIQEGNSVPQRDNLACIHMDFLHAGQPADMIWESGVDENGQQNRLSHVMPLRCNEGEDLGFFAALEGESARNLFTLKRLSNNTFYQQCSDWIIESKPPLDVHNIPPRLTIRDIYLQGGFKKSNMVIRGNGVYESNASEPYDYATCEQLCESSAECILWSFEFTLNEIKTNHNAESVTPNLPKRNTCFHINASSDAVNMTVEYKHGSITSTNSRLIPLDKDELCILENATLTLREDEDYLTLSKQNYEDCQRSCLELDSFACVGWIHNATNCIYLREDSFKGKMHIVPRLGHHVGFATCQDKSVFYQHTQMPDYEVMMMEVREFPRTKSYLILKKERGKLDVWNPELPQGDWLIIGQKMDVGEYNHDEGIYAARIILGNPLTNPSSASTETVLSGYKRHRHEDEGKESSLTFWRLNCPLGYKSMGNIGTFQAQLNLSHYACIKEHFLVNTKQQKPIGTFSTHQGNEYSFYDVEPNNHSLNTGFFIGNEQHAYLLKHAIGTIFSSYSYQELYAFNGTKHNVEIIPTTEMSEVETADTTHLVTTTLESKTTSSDTPTTHQVDHDHTMTTNKAVVEHKYDEIIESEELSSMEIEFLDQRDTKISSWNANLELIKQTNKSPITFRTWQPSEWVRSDHFIIGQVMGGPGVGHEERIFPVARLVSGSALAVPLSWRRVQQGIRKKMKGFGSAWTASCPEDFISLGDVVISDSDEDSLIKERFRCVSNQFVVPATLSMDPDKISLDSYQLVEITPDGNSPDNPGLDLSFFKYLDKNEKLPEVFTLPRTEQDDNDVFVYQMNSLKRKIQIKDDLFKLTSGMSDVDYDLKAYDWIQYEGQSKENWHSLGQISKVHDGEWTTGLIARDVEGYGLKPAIGARPILTARMSNLPNSKNVTFWRLTCDDGYNALGDVVFREYTTPKWDSYACVHIANLEPMQDLTTKISFVNINNGELFSLIGIGLDSCSRDLNHFYVYTDDEVTLFHTMKSFRNFTCDLILNKETEETERVELADEMMYDEGFAPEYYQDLPVYQESASYEQGKSAIEESLLGDNNEIWRCFTKINVLVKGKLVSTEKEKSNIEICKESCNSDEKCKIWSFMKEGNSPTETGCFQLGDNNRDITEIVHLQDAYTESVACGSDVQGSDMDLCIFRQDVKISVNANTISYAASDSFMKCQDLCQEKEEKECWIWVFNTSHCGIIPISTEKVSLLNSNASQGMTIGFHQCDSQDISNPSNQPGDPNAMLSRGRCNEVKETSFLIAFIVTLILLLIALMYICYKRRKKIEDFHVERQEVSVQAANIGQKESLEPGVAEVKSRVRKTSYKNLLKRSNLPLILSLRTIQEKHPSNEKSVIHADVEKYVVTGGEEQIEDTKSEGENFIFSQAMVHSHELEAFDNDLKINSARTAGGTVETGDYLQLDSVLGLSGDTRMKYSNQAARGRTSSIVAFQVLPPPTSINTRTTSIGGNLQTVILPEEISSSMTKTQKLLGENANQDDVGWKGSNGRKSSVSTSFQYQPKYNYKAVSTGDPANQSAASSGFNVQVVEEGDISSSRVGGVYSTGVVKKYGFIPIQSNGKFNEEVQEIIHED